MRNLSIILASSLWLTSVSGLAVQGADPAPIRLAGAFSGDNRTSSDWEGSDPKSYYDPGCNGDKGFRPVVSVCEPLWNVYVGAIILDRSPGTLAAEGVGTASFPWRAGVDVDLRRRLGDIHQLQVRYFGVDSWDGDSLMNQDDLQYNYLSSLHSTEVNLRRQTTDCLTLLGGFRWVELSEEVSELPGKGDPVRARNHLYGGQIGAELLVWDRCGPLRVTSGVRAGIFHNRASYDAPTLEVSDRTSHTAFLGEFDVTARYQVTPSLALRTGYQLLWLEGVALSGNQLDNVIPPGPVDTSGSPFYHGVTIGAELSF